MSIAKYRAFIQVIESGSLTKAAKKMGYTQPGISHMIDSLEDDIGFPLLIRNKEKIVPTENGKELLYYCYQIVKSERDLRETVSAINGIMEGTIKIGAYNSLLINYVPQVVRNFVRTYPNVTINLQEICFADFSEHLPKGTLDLGFMVDDIPKNISFIPLFRDKPCVIMRDDHPLASFEKIPPTLLNGCDFIMPIDAYGDIIDNIQTKTPFTPNVKVYVGSDVAVYSLVAYGLGLSIISSLQTASLPPHVIAKEVDGDFGRNLGIALKSFKLAPPAVKEFIRISKETASHMTLEQLSRR